MTPWLALALSLSLAEPSPPSPPADNPLGERIMQGAMVEGRLWLRSDQGVVAGFDDARARWTVHERNVVDLQVQNGVLWLLQKNAVKPGDFQIIASRKGWRQTWRMKLDVGERVLALLPGKAPTFLSDKALYQARNGDWRRTPLRLDTPSLRFGRGVAVASPSADGHAVYLGFNRGEWGGELDRIDLASGRVVKLTDANVTGVMADPRRPDCMIVSEGLVHMIMAGGAVVGVCNERQEMLYRRDLDKAESDVPGNGEPIWSVTADGRGGFWAVGFAIHHFAADGARSDLKTPEFEDQAGVRVSRAVPGIVLVLTDSNQRFSVSMRTPLVIAD